ncbi:MAG: alpha/beta fold hydrolase [Myxococcota bacterium]
MTWAGRCCIIAGLLSLVGCVASSGVVVREHNKGRHSLVVRGSGDPTVILEAGLGGDLSVWSDVLGPVSEFTRVLAYNRAGYGRSKSESAHRDGLTAVDELRSLLRALHIPPPFVLVGHSLGGQYVELFARTFPEETAGVVFVDARHVDFSDRCRPEGVERCETPGYVRLFMPAAARAELLGTSATEAQIRAAGPFPNVPFRVLSATQRPENMPNLRRLWAESQADLVLLGEQGQQEICEACGHFIQRDDPERVIKAIRDVIDSAR